jgi:hypothetical protein
MVQRLVVHAARRPVYRKLVMAGVLAAAGLAILYGHRFPAVGWALVAVGGLTGMLLLWSLGEDRERLVIDDAGIRDTLLPVGTIAWSDVRGASVRQIGSVSVVQLDLHDPGRFIARLPAPRRFIARRAGEAGLPALYLTLVGTDADPARIAELIRGRIRPSASP